MARRRGRLSKLCRGGEFESPEKMGKTWSFHWSFMEFMGMLGIDLGIYAGIFRLQVQVGIDDDFMDIEWNFS